MFLLKLMIVIVNNVSQIVDNIYFALFLNCEFITYFVMKSSFIVIVKTLES